MTGGPSSGVSRKEPPRVDAPQSPVRPQTTQPPSEAAALNANPNIELFKAFVGRTERGNIIINKLNLLRKQRRLESQNPAEVSDDDIEDKPPNISSFISTTIHSCGTSTAHVSTLRPVNDPHNASPAAGRKSVAVSTLGPSSSSRNSSAADACPSASMKSSADWHVLMTAHSPVAAKADHIDFSKIGPVFTIAEASKNKYELYPTSIPEALKQMAYYRVFIPLSMFTTDSMNIIRDNVGDLYTKKNGLSAGTYILNAAVFPGEDTLTEWTFFQAYRNWLRLLSSVAEPEVYAGWHDHHEQMIEDTNFSRSFEAWKAHDGHLRASFFIAPYILDVNSSAYINGFYRAWLDAEMLFFRKDRSDDQRSFRSSSSLRPQLNSRNVPASSSSARYAPYGKPSDSFRDRKKKGLCFRCGRSGHRASKCHATWPGKPGLTSFLVEWRNDKLVTINSNRNICITFNIRSFCPDDASPSHGDHSCSLCGDMRHGASTCARN